MLNKVGMHADCLPCVCVCGWVGAVCRPGRGGTLLDGESPQAVGEADVVGLLEALLRLPKLAAAAREVALTAAMKLTARLPSQVRRGAACA